MIFRRNKGWQAILPMLAGGALLSGSTFAQGPFKSLKFCGKLHFSGVDQFGKHAYKATVLNVATGEVLNVSGFNNDPESGGEYHCSTNKFAEGFDPSDYKVTAISAEHHDQTARGQLLLIRPDGDELRVYYLFDFDAPRTRSSEADSVERSQPEDPTQQTSNEGLVRKAI